MFIKTFVTLTILLTGAFMVTYNFYSDSSTPIDTQTSNERSLNVSKDFTKTPKEIEQDNTDSDSITIKKTDQEFIEKK